MTAGVCAWCAISAVCCPPPAALCILLTPRCGGAKILGSPHVVWQLRKLLHSFVNEGPALNIGPATFLVSCTDCIGELRDKCLCPRDFRSFIASTLLAELDGIGSRGRRRANLRGLECEHSCCTDHRSCSPRWQLRRSAGAASARWCGGRGAARRAGARCGHRFGASVWRHHSCIAARWAWSRSRAHWPRRTGWRL